MSIGSSLSRLTSIEQPRNHQANVVEKPKHDLTKPSILYNKVQAFYDSVSLFFTLALARLKILLASFMYLLSGNSFLKP